MRLCSKMVLLAVPAVLTVMAAGPDGTQRITSVVRPDLRTGKLVRSVIVTSRPVSQQTVPETVIPPHVVPSGIASAEETRVRTGGIDDAVEQIAAQHALPAQLIHSVIKVESNYNPFAVSPKGAQGLMQLIPSTARRFGVSNSFNPVENIQGGAKYLKYLLNLYDGNYPLALAAYNAGEAAVAKYGGVPPYAETQNYLILVRKQLEAARKSSPVKSAAVPAEKPAETGPAHIQEVVQPDGTVRYVTR